MQRISAATVHLGIAARADSVPEIVAEFLDQELPAKCSPGYRIRLAKRSQQVNRSASSPAVAMQATYLLFQSVPAMPDIQLS